ncbi:MAG: hypothetical protein IT363_10360 [Methanoregulaceae archaeon]|nr:hypothetical protein [Methanoregulaceae archaeon]
MLLLVCGGGGDLVAANPNGGLLRTNQGERWRPTVDALVLEIHPDPEHALSDAATQWPLDRAEELFEQIARIRAAAPG